MAVGCSETFTHLYPQWQRGLDSEVPLAYVRRAMVNRYLSDRRRAGRRPESFWEVPDLPDEQDDYTRVLDRQALDGLLALLSPKQRAAVTLRYYHGHSDEEIAEIIGCRHATVRSLIRRGLVIMRAAHAVSNDVTEGQQR